MSTDIDKQQRPGGTTPITVEVRAGADPLWRSCELSLHNDALHLTRDENNFALRFTLLAGFCLDDNVFTLFTSADSNVELRQTGAGKSQELAEVACQVDARVRVMREATRSLRALGAQRGRPGADHDRFFEPLLAAKRRAESQDSPSQRIAEFDAPRISAEIEKSMHSFASDRFPSQLPERRALTESLKEAAAPLQHALAALDQRAVAARDADSRTQFVAWREWLAAIDAVFSEADRAWLEISAMLRHVTVERPGLWRRLFP